MVHGYLLVHGGVLTERELREALDLSHRATSLALGRDRGLGPRGACRRAAAQPPRTLRERLAGGRRSVAVAPAHREAARRARGRSCRAARRDLPPSRRGRPACHARGRRGRAAPGMAARAARVPAAVRAGGRSPGPGRVSRDRARLLGARADPRRVARPAAAAVRLVARGRARQYHRGHLARVARGGTSGTLRSGSRRSVWHADRTPCRLSTDPISRPIPEERVHAPAQPPSRDPRRIHPRRGHRARRDGPGCARTRERATRHPGSPGPPADGGPLVDPRPARHLDGHRPGRPGRRRVSLARSRRRSRPRRRTRAAAPAARSGRRPTAASRSCCWARTIGEARTSASGWTRSS